MIEETKHPKTFPDAQSQCFSKVDKLCAFHVNIESCSKYPPTAAEVGSPLKLWMDKALIISLAGFFGRILFVQIIFWIMSHRDAWCFRFGISIWWLFFPEAYDTHNRSGQAELGDIKTFHELYRPSTMCSMCRNPSFNRESLDPLKR